MDVTRDPGALAIIGGGLVGLATAWRYLETFPGGRVTVLEKEPRIAAHQSGHNSGVLHAGLAYRPGSAKARLAAAGLRELLEFCRRHDVPHQQCGKLVVAATDAEVGRLRALMEQGARNGLQGLAWVPGEAIAEYEPHARGAAALHVPEEGVVDFPQVAEVLARLIRDRGGAVITGAEVTRIGWMQGWHLETTAGHHAADFLVNCAGLHADRVARMAGARPPVRIIPFRGEYFTLRRERAHLVRHLVYPVAPPGLPFLGVHFTRRINGVVDAGPNARLVLSREGYRGRAWRLRDAGEILAFPGLYRFALRNPRVVSQELRQAVSRRRFVEQARRLIPELESDDLVPGGSGVRAQALAPDGSLVEDFCLEAGPRSLHVLNAPSPAATACLAIGAEIVRRVGG